MRLLTEYRRQLNQQPQSGYLSVVSNILVADDAFCNAFGLFNWCVIFVVEKITSKKATIEFERHVCRPNVLVCCPNVMQQASSEVCLI